MGQQPQQPEQRRSERGGNTHDAVEKAARSGQMDKRGGSRAHGTDKGAKGGGRGGGVPPEQQPPHPA